MRKASGATLALILVASVCFAAGAASGATSDLYPGGQILAGVGSIRGTVLCGEPGEGFTPRPDSTVWVRGRSFSALTDADGSFTFDFIPAGTYSIGVMTAGRMVRTPKVSGGPVLPESPYTDEVIVSPRSAITVYLFVTGGCGACGGGGGGGGCEEGGSAG